jgi:hypothetical protein
MTRTWFIARNKQKFGPFTTGQLQQLATLDLVKPTEYVLPEGGNKWVSAALVEGLFPSVEKQKKYWLSVGGRPQGPHLVEQIRLALIGRRLSAQTLACLDGGQQWSALGQIDDFLECIPSASRDSQAHLGAGSSSLHLTREEAELHLAGKQGDLIAKLLSTLLDLKRRYAQNASLLEVIEKNIDDLKAIRERGLPEESLASGLRRMTT